MELARYGADLHRARPRRRRCAECSELFDVPRGKRPPMTCSTECHRERHNRQHREAANRRRADR